MPKFIVERYELHMTEHEVAADNPAQAVKRLLSPTSLSVNQVDCSTFLEVAEQYGMSAQENQELASELRQLGVPVSDIIPGIRQVYRLRQE